MTIGGNLNRDNAQALSKFMSVEPQIRLWDILQTKFKAKALQEKVYIEYDKVRKLFFMVVMVSQKQNILA